MPSTKMFVFDPVDLVRLITHYSDGEVPLDCEVKGFMVNENLQRFIGIEVQSKEWDDFKPYHFRYDGKRVMGWTSSSGEQPVWTESNETPSRQ